MHNKEIFMIKFIKLFIKDCKSFYKELKNDIKKTIKKKVCKCGKK